MNRSKKLTLLLGMIFAAVLLSACGRSKTDYSNSANWIAVASDEEQSSKDADVFFLYPTPVEGDYGSGNQALTDEKYNAYCRAVTYMEQGIYDGNAAFFAPYYESAYMGCYKLPTEEREAYLAKAYEDVSAAFDYYYENYNNNRPIVLAGFSQGADMVTRLLKDKFANPSLSGKLVAAYVIGYGVTDEELKAYPHLKMATGQYDTGVIVNFGTKSENLAESVIMNSKIHGINPLNWKTDNTVAEPEENLGACFMDFDREKPSVRQEIPAFCGAYLDKATGMVNVTGVDEEEYPSGVSFFPKGEYHIYDYQFFYRNLQQNVLDRIEEYQQLQILKARNIGMSKSFNLQHMNGYEQSDDIRLAPDTTVEMLKAQYWIQNVKDPDRVLMTEEEIANFNARNHQRNEELSFADFVGEGRKTELSASEQKAIVGELCAGPERKYLNGKPLTEEYWNHLVEIRGDEAIRDSVKVKYGVTVERASLRTMPTADITSSSEKFTFTDEFQNSSALMNEPVVVLLTSTDNKWYYVQTDYCRGWIDASIVATTDNYQAWVRNTTPENFLVITENTAELDVDPMRPKLSRRELSMGTKLEIVNSKQYLKSSEGREAYDNYVVRMPVRMDNGSLSYQNAYLPANISVSIGYLPATQRNILTLAFDCVGERYGWGGMYHARDCSQYVMEMYRCFGIHTARNTTGMMKMDTVSLNINGMPDRYKENLLDLCPAGSILLFPGHAMIYVGNENGIYYVISDTGSVVMKDDSERKGVKPHSIILSSLDNYRGNGRTWMESLTMIKLPL